MSWLIPAVNPLAERCDHGRTWACPFPGCPKGIPGEQLVLCGPEGVAYFVRGFVEEGGEVKAGWVERPKVEVTLARIVRKSDEKRKLRAELAEVANVRVAQRRV